MLHTTVTSASDSILLFDAGAGMAQGGRSNQEDRYNIILPDQFPARTSDKLAFFAVYDGHGSPMVSEHARRNLLNLLVQRPEFNAGDYEEAIAKALRDEDGILLETVRTQSAEPAVSGSTVALCLINLTKAFLVVGNLGDSHIILAEKGSSTDAAYSTERLTVSHKPNVPSEKSRIEKAGGLVRRHGGSTRIGIASPFPRAETRSTGKLEFTNVPWIGTLNMSRALGDLQYKNPINTLEASTEKTRKASASRPETRGDFLSSEPHLRRVALKKESRYVLVCSTDGVTDSTGDQMLIEHIMKKAGQGLRAVNIAQDIASGCASGRESDNCTCLVAFLDGTKS